MSKCSGKERGRSLGESVRRGDFDQYLRRAVFMLGRTVPGGGDGKIIDPSKKPVLLRGVVHPGRRKGNETVLGVVGPRGASSHGR